MSLFIKHTNCERCGSSDAFALYRGGGGFCFSCRHSKRGSVSPYVTAVEPVVDEEVTKLPSDSGFDYSPSCLKWVFQYGLSINELIKNKVFWSESRQQLLFTFWDEGELLMYQARNFGEPAPGRRPLKYYTKGKPEETLQIYGGVPGLRGVLVIVEDCISAIKIARQCSAMPVLGSDLSLSKLKRLERALGTFLGASREVVVWLDSNMYHKAQRIANRLQMLGVEARAVFTELDPKCYSDTEIATVLARRNLERSEDFA